MLGCRQQGTTSCDMKFGRQWHAMVAQQVPAALRGGCLDYKKFKKLTKLTNLTSPAPAPGDPAWAVRAAAAVRAELDRDCRAADRVFAAAPSRSSCLPPFVTVWRRGGREEGGGGEEDRMEFARLNTLALYKICKRADKRLGLRTFVPWYQAARAGRKYAFLSRMSKVLHDLRHAGPAADSECPACLEPVARCEEYLVLGCGHLMCQACALSMLGVARARGTLRNRIAHGCHEHRNMARCPVCRDPTAFQEIAHFTAGQ